MRRDLVFARALATSLSRCLSLSGACELCDYLCVCVRVRELISDCPRYVACQGLANKARELVNGGEVRIVPGDYQNEWNRWLGTHPTLGV